jgi:hypothetical protein
VFLGVTRAELGDELAAVRGHEYNEVESGRI